MKPYVEGNSPEPLTSWQILACSGTAKMCASMATYPHEVVRTRLQTQRRLLSTPNIETSTSSAESARIAKAMSDPEAQKQRGGVIFTAKKIVTREGWRGLYKGLSINLIRTVPNSAVTMLTYVLRCICLAQLTIACLYVQIRTINEAAHHPRTPKPQLIDLT